MTVFQWFAANPQAAQQAISQTRSGMGSRPLVAWLRENHGYPYRDTALRKYLKMSGTRSAPAPRPAPTRFFRSESDVKDLDRCEDFFVTCAVSSSPANLPALRALEHAAAECNGKIVCTPIRYVNPTRPGEEKRAEWWASELAPYMIENEIRPHPLLSLMTTKVQATANNPLPRSVDGRTKARSAVFGHPQLAMRTVPTPQNPLPKILYTSGAITDRNYSDTLAGDLASHHHTVGAVKVEIRGKRFHLREVTWDGEKFIDLDRMYTPEGVVDAPPAEALVLGDIHVGLEDQEVLDAVFRAYGIVDSLAPRRLFLHDLFDGRTVNPHERGNALLAAARAGHRVADELGDVVQWLADYTDPFEEVNIVRSNHDAFLDRWLAGAQPSPQDASLFHWLSWQMISEFEESGEFPIALELALRRFDLNPNVRFLKMDESYMLGGLELGMHGHAGINGARGGPSSMSRLGVRFVSGHIHSPCIHQGGYWAGLMARMRHGYNQGPSGWLHSQVVVNANFHRQMAHCIGDKFRG